MKRIGKSLLAAVLVLSLTFCLCSCAALDEVKASRAELRTEAGEEVILFRGSFYRPVDLTPADQLSLHVDFYDTAYVADPDVPALLLSKFGTSSPCNKDATVLYYNGEYYLREDRYDDLCALLKGGLSRYCVTDRDEEFTQIYPLIPAEYTELLDTLTALTDTSSHFLPDVPEDGDYAFSRTFFRCDKDVSFRMAEYNFVRLSKDGSGSEPVKETYLINEDNGFSVQIPEEYLPAVDRMIDSLDLFDPLPWKW